MFAETLSQEAKLTPAQRATFNQTGWIALPDVLPASTRANLAGWADAVADQGSPGRRLHYHEQGPAGRMLCRTERFIEDHPGFASLLSEGPLVEMASALIGEPAVLYKEKINYKQPGGAGFRPHQDATAYAFVSRNVTCLVAIDAMTRESGCLEFASYGGAELLPGDGDGCLDPAFADSLAWEAAELPMGGAVFFTSHVPHRSSANTSPRPRRALYVTFSAASEGDRRADYYAGRETVIATAGGDRARVSVIGHFEGRAAD